MRPPGVVLGRVHGKYPTQVLLAEECPSLSTRYADTPIPTPPEPPKLSVRPPRIAVDRHRESTRLGTSSTCYLQLTHQFASDWSVPRQPAHRKLAQSDALATGLI